MPIFLWDASALAKRYAPENGSLLVNALFGAAFNVQHITTAAGYAETFSLLLRKWNRHDLEADGFRIAISALDAEVIRDETFSVLHITFSDVMAGIPLIQRHNINSTDAGILACFLQFAEWTDEQCILVASDKRLLRAARVEGLRTLNPEESRVEDVLGLPHTP